jgi:hypothetical protein
MDSKVEILLLKFEQTDEAIWDAILCFTVKWNRTKENKFISDEQAEVVICFSKEDHKEMQELENILEKKQEESEWVWIKTITGDPTKEEIEAHDYIQVIGDGYPDEFFLNESKVLSPVKPCENCGTVHPHLMLQKGALQVNEVFLDQQKIYPNSKYFPLGVDIVNMSHGALLVSKKVEQLLKGIKGLKGYNLLDVFDQHENVSDRLYQLVAIKVILLPDNLNSEGTICPVCGTVLSTMTNIFTIKKSRLGGSNFFSRSSSGISSIYVSKSLYEIFKSENIRSLTPVQGANLIND